MVIGIHNHCTVNWTVNSPQPVWATGIFCFNVQFSGVKTLLTYVGCVILAYSYSVYSLCVQSFPGVKSRGTFSFISHVIDFNLPIFLTS